MNYHSKKEEKISYLQDNITKLKKEIQGDEEKIRENTKHLPTGQVVSKSFHKELNFYDKRIIENLDKIKYYKERIETIKNNNKIYLGESDSIKRLREKLGKLEKEKAKKIEINKIIKSKKLSLKEKIKIFEEDPIFEKFFNKEFYELSEEEKREALNNIIFPPYTYRNGKIKGVKEQLEKALALEKREEKEEDYEKGLLIINPSINRVQIDFKDIPSKEIREDLKKNNFKFTSEGLWQNYLNERNIKTAREFLTKEYS